MAVNRFYSNTAVVTALTGTVSTSATTLSVGSTSGFPSSTPYTLVVDRDTATEELVTVTAVAGTNLTVERGSDNTPQFSHSSGAPVEHTVSARDYREPQAHIAATADVHGVTGTLIGATNTVALTNKDLSSASNLFPLALATDAELLAVSNTLTTSITNLGTTVATNPQKWLGYVSSTTSDTTIGSGGLDLTNLTLTLTLAASRKIRVSGACTFRDNGSGGVTAIMSLKEGATTLNSDYIGNLAASEFCSGRVEAVLALAAGAHTFKLNAEVTGSMKSIPVGIPAWLLVEDLGAA